MKYCYKINENEHWIKYSSIASIKTSSPDTENKLLFY